MFEVVIIFFLISIYLYALFGGADFGAGIIELTTAKNKKDLIRKLTTKAIAPVWEANHIWLIIAVVILFTAFPEAFSRVSISLYLPLLALLVGIVFRGTAFTFRYYDAVKDYTQEIYSRFFEWSSLITPFFFGVFIGGLVGGEVTVTSKGFIENYIFSWLTFFSFSIGIFVVALFAFLASIFLIGETDDDETRKYLINKGKMWTIILVSSGLLVFITSIIEDRLLFNKFFSNYFSITLILIASIVLILLWEKLKKGKIWSTRFLSGIILFSILGAFYLVYFPNLIIIKDANNITFYNSKAPDITFKYLGWALILGSLFIFPSLIYLMRIFKIEKREH